MKIRLYSSTPPSLMIHVVVNMKNARIESMGTSSIPAQYIKKMNFLEEDLRPLLWESNTSFRKIEYGRGMGAYTT
jgi:hypothetical protein